MNEREKARFRATTGTLQGFGETPGDALAALMSNPAAQADRPIIIWPYNQGDAFFTAEQQARLEDLKRRRDQLTDVERRELESLIEAAFDATIARTQSLPLVRS